MKKLIIIVIVLIVGVAWFYYPRTPEVIEVDLPPAQEFEEFIIEEVVEEEEIVVEEEKEVAGVKIEQTNINLDIPFISQAPTANWDQPFQDACEEVSILMVDYYYANKQFPNKEEVEEILLEMVKWQEDNWSGHFNLPVEEVALFTETTFGYRTEIIEDLTAAKIKEYLNKGIPVIVPADGRKLDNPYFTGEGPEYHMLVIKGYVDDKFITNDPGTRRGADFVYTADNLLSSIADWDKQKSLTEGPKRALVLYNN